MTNEQKNSEYDPRAVANLILQVIHNPPTQLALQKLLYFAHGAFLLRTKRPLVSGYFEAWNYGPVHPAIYAAFKKHGNSPISNLAKRKDIRTGAFLEISIPTDPDVVKTTKKVVSSLEDMTPGQLVALSHADGGPWHQVYRRSKSEHMLGLRISNEMIRERYRAHWFPADKLESVDEPTEDSPITYYRSG